MDFPDSEFEMRLEKAQRLMKARGLDALFITSEPELRYFTGFRTLFLQSPTRPWFLVLPQAGEPIAIIPEIGAQLMRQTWVRDIRTWSSPDEVDDGISLLADALADFRTIGMMMGRESCLRMPMSDFHELRDRLRQADFVDSSVLIADVRFEKSAAEIEVLRAICGIGSAAFDQADALFNVGQPFDESFRAFKIELLRQGAEDVPYLVGGKGRLGYDDVISPPSSDPIREGDVMMLDTGATLRGYFCDFDRNFSFGPADPRVAETYRILWQATEAGLEVARPGVTCGQVFEAMQKVIFERSGTHSSDVGRYGHGLGIQLTETPSLIGWDKTVLRAGAALTLEPSMAVPGGGMMVHEENIVIREGEPELLTKRAPAELPVLS